MAILEINFYSKCLQRTVDIMVIHPIDKVVNDKEINLNKKFKTLYLLHGYLGDHNDWLYNTRIKRWALAKDLVVIMPSGENKFYLDKQDTKEFYSTFIGEELVKITRKMFNLSDKREDTFIAGLSMGGYGAIYNGLKYNNTFGYIGGLSSALYFKGNVFKQFVKKYENYDFVKYLTVENIPHLYLACGREDFLLAYNRKLVKLLNKHNIEYTYVEDDGGHDWDFWDKYIAAFLCWLPLNKDNEGKSSGNIK